MACAFAEEWYHELLVDWNEDECVDGAEHGDRTCGDFEVASEVSVGDVGLAYEEG